MITYSIVLKSQLEGAQRLDAEYYQPEYLEVKKRLLSKSHFVLGRHTFITDGEHGSVDFVDDGVKYLVAENIQEGFLNLDSIRYVSKRVDERNKRASLEPRDVTLSIKGTIGLAAMAFEEDLPANMNRDVSRIHIKDTIDPFFLTVFLNSNFGRGQTLRESSGNVQQMITLGRTRTLLIPKAPKSLVNKIREIFLNSYEELKKSEKFYFQAENLLLKKLGLKDFKPKDELSYIVNFSEIKKVNRMDAEYFQPKYNQILKKLSLQRVEILEKNFELIKSKNFQYTKDGKVGVIKTKQLGKQFVDFNVESATSSTILETGRPPVVQDRDILFASMGVGSLGKTNIFYKFEAPDRVFTTDSTLRIFRQKPNSQIMPEILAVFLCSDIGQELVYKHIVGTSGIISIYQKYLESLPVPILPKSTQQKIANLVRKSHQTRKKSKELLEMAKRKVEEMIDSTSFDKTQDKSSLQVEKGGE